MGSIIIYHKDFDKIIVNKHASQLWKPSRRIEDEIDDIWAEKLSHNEHLWSGPMVRLDKIVMDGKTLCINTSLTSYKQHVGTRTNTELSTRANPVYVSANIITADNYLLFGKCKNVERGVGKHNIAAGSLHPVLDSPDGVPSLGVGLYREIFEEFGLIPESFESVKPHIVFGLESEPTGSFLYNVKLKLTSKDVQQKFNALTQKSESYGVKPEFDSIHFLESDSKIIRDELKNKKVQYQPMVEAMLDYIY